MANSLSFWARYLDVAQVSVFSMGLGCCLFSQAGLEAVDPGAVRVPLKGFGVPVGLIQGRLRTVSKLLFMYL